MNPNLSAGDEPVQSFVVRLWQESPGRWRGSVRHVQSQAQRGITSIAQASAFMTEQCRASSLAEAPRQTESKPALRALPSLGGRGLRLAGVAAALAVAFLALVFLSQGPSNTVLAGTAIDGNLPDGLPLFVGGMLVGGLAVSWWFRRQGRS